MSTTRPITTAEELQRADDLGRAELVRGELAMMTPAGNPHGRITFELGLAIGLHVRDHDLGVMYTAETGFVLERNPDTVRAPDVAFVRKGRAPALDEPGFVEGAPDLAVEVLSPEDRAGAVNEKVRDWLRAGAQQVWVVDPESRTVTVHQPDGHGRFLREDQTLTGGELLPGFELPVAEVFKR